MSSVQHMRDFICQRLTAAAEEIFTEFEKTVVHYEEEIDRQRRLLEITLSPRVQLHRIVIPQQLAVEKYAFADQKSFIWKIIPEQQVCKKKEVFAYQKLCNEERDSRLNQGVPKTPQIKEEHKELCTNQGEKIKEETETNAFTLSPAHQEWDFGEVDTDPDQPNSQTSPLTERQNQEGMDPTIIGSSKVTEMKAKNGSNGDMGHSSYDNSVLSEYKSNVESDEQSVKSVCKESLRDECDEKTTDTTPQNSKTKTSTCGTSVRNSSFVAHMRTHFAERPFSCEVCRKLFSQTSDLENHMRTHIGENPFLCPTCGKRFKTSSQFYSHQKVHLGGKPFVCTICGKGFPVKYHLKVHERTHSGEKPFVCTICGKGFSVKYNLDIHKRTHSGEKPFVCTICGKGFSAKRSLDFHNRTNFSE